MDRWKLEKEIIEIIEDNCEEIPWEGTEINKAQLKEDILELIENLEN